MPHSLTEVTTDTTDRN